MRHNHSHRDGVLTVYDTCRPQQVNRKKCEQPKDSHAISLLTFVGVPYGRRQRGPTSGTDRPSEP